MFSAHTVTGTGIKQVKSILIATGPNARNKIRQFNDSHDNYLLIYPSSLTNSFSDSISNPALSYKDLSKAAAIIEYETNIHNGHPLGHFTGQMDMTSKFFAVMDSESKEKLFALLDKGEEFYENEEVIKSIKIMASEKHNRLVVLE